MDSRRWDEIQATFHALVDLDTSTRVTRLAALGSTDPELRQAVESLLAADAVAQTRLAPLEATFRSGPAPAPDLLSLAGRTISHFHVLEPLGAGGMGVVYRAEDTRLNRAVALKFLLPQYGLDAAAKERFLREAHSAAALDHPNLCTIYEVGESEDRRLFLAMALYPGETLKARLAREGPLPVEDALAIAQQIAEGLACAHAAGIVHRDLKPGNVMLLPDGTVKILDFGLAKMRDQSLSGDSARLGTVAYMAPEQIRGEAVDARTDLWALGVVLYEMLTGKRPFGGEHDVSIAHAILHDEPERPSTLRPEASAAIVDLVLTLLQKDPDQRHPAAEQVLVHLVDVGALAGSAVRSAGKRSLSSRRIQFGRRRWMLAVGSLTAVGIVGVFVWTAWKNGRTHAGQPEIVQLTFSGNARTPALSPDGQRLAYSTRQCGTDARCTVDAIVQDMEGAGRATVARGLGEVANIQWTSDGRYLLVNGWWPDGDQFGPFIVPSLGGAEPRYLGCCTGAIVGNTDTVLVGERPGSDSAAWLRWVTIADGVTRDSLLIPKRVRPMIFLVDPVGGGQKNILKMFAPAGMVGVTVVDRSGRVFDSVPLQSSRLRVVQPSPDGRGLLVGLVSGEVTEEGGSAVPLDLLMYPLGENGRIGSRPDTIMRGLIAYAGLMPLSIARNGTLTYASGPTIYELWLLRRGGGSGLISARRRLAAATGYLDGKISPDGRWVGILRSLVLRDRQLKQFSIMSSDSGPERPVGPPRDVVGWEWSAGSSRVLLAIREGDTISIRAVDVAGGASRVLAVMDKDETDFADLSGGGVVIVKSGTRLRRSGVPGLGDSVLDVTHDYLAVASVSSPPEGHTVAIVGPDRKIDSLLVSRVSLVNGHADRIAAFLADPGDRPAWLDDGSLIISVRPSQTVEWYRVPADGGRPLHLGTAPWSSATYSWSADGRRILATVRNDMADVYAIRDFGNLLRR